MANESMPELLTTDGGVGHDEESERSSKNAPDAIRSGMIGNEIRRLPGETVQDIYKLAYEFYHHGKLNDAESLFRSLCIYDFYNPEYALGLAAVYQLKKDYTRAIDFYALAYSRTRDDYRPLFYAGQCNLMLHHTTQARRCFETVINRCNDLLLIGKANSYLSALNNLNNHEYVKK